MTPKDSKLKNLTDAELIEKIVAGDQGCLAILLDRYQQYIYMKCKGYVKDADTAADLSQDILIKLFLKVPNFKNQAKFSTWLFTTIHNACIDYLRKHKKSIHLVLTEKLSDQVAEIVDFDEELSEEKTVEVLEKLLDQLTPEDKLILLLKYKEKHQIKDIQHTMGLSESAVKMRLKRAKEKLNKLYGNKLDNI